MKRSLNDGGNNTPPHKVPEPKRERPARDESKPTPKREGGDDPIRTEPFQAFRNTGAESTQQFMTTTPPTESR